MVWIKKQQFRYFLGVLFDGIHILVEMTHSLYSVGQYNDRNATLCSFCFTTFVKL